MTEPSKTIITDPLQYAVIRLGRMSSRSAGGLVIPDFEKRKNLFGTVTQPVGSSFYPEDYRGRDIRVGDVVLLRDWYSTIEIEHVGKNLHMVKFENIVGWIIGDQEVHDDRWAEEMLSQKAEDLQEVQSA